jgi:hypothetical protein
MDDPFKEDDIGKSMLDEIKALCDNLLRPLILEPFTDPGFERSVEKLRAIVNETQNYIDRLRTAAAHFPKWPKYCRFKTYSMKLVVFLMALALLGFLIQT